MPSVSQADSLSRRPNGSLTELQAGFTWLRQSGTPLAATRECARKRRDASRAALPQALQRRGYERRLDSSCEKLGRRRTLSDSPYEIVD
jgi:hypothetical protein